MLGKRYRRDVTGRAARERHFEARRITILPSCRVLWTRCCTDELGERP